jgi:hypothetical protein
MLKRQQFTISPELYDEKVYTYLDHLSRSRKLSKKVSEWAANDLKGTTRSCSCESMRQELQEIKEMLYAALTRGRLWDPYGIPKEINSDLLQVSTDTVVQVLDEDLDYKNL